MPPFVYGSDEACLIAALQGSENAWSVLESRLAKPLNRVAERWSPELAPDLRAEITQESWSVAVRRTSADFSADIQTAIGFLAEIVPNAAQRVRAAYRVPGARSRIKRARRRVDDHHVPWNGWNHSPSTSLDAVSATTARPGWDSSASAVDARIDIDRAMQVAPPNVARAMHLILESGASFAAAAAAVNLSTPSLMRCLAALAIVLRTSRAA